MLSQASNFPELIHPLHLSNVSCELLPILQISDAISLPSTPEVFSPRERYAALLYDLSVTARIIMPYNSESSHILSPLDRKFFKGKNYALLRWCLPGSW